MIGDVAPEITRVVSATDRSIPFHIRAIANLPMIRGHGLGRAECAPSWPRSFSYRSRVSPTAPTHFHNA